LRRLHFLWSYLGDAKGRFLGSLVLLTLVSATSLVFPWLLKIMVDRLQLDAAVRPETTTLALLLLGLLVLSTAVGYRQQIIMQAIGYRLRNSLREAFFQSLLARPMAFHREQQLGELSARLAEDIGRVQTLPGGFAAPLFQNTIFMAGCIVLMAALSGAATAVVLPLLLLPMPVVILTGRAIRSYAARSQAAHASATALFEESLGGIREIKAMAAEERTFARYCGILAEAFSSEVSASRQHVILNQSVYFLLSGLLIGIFYLGSERALFSQWSVGSIIAFYFYAYTLSMALISQARLLASHQSILGAIDRVIDVLAPAEAGAEPSGGYSATVRGEVLLEEVDFSYTPDRPVFTRLSLRIPDAGWSVVTGPSGSGKSTIAHLILGLDRPTSGRVLLDGVPVSGWQHGLLLRQVGFVGQEPALFHGTIRENILAGRPDLPARGVTELLRVCCIDEFIASLPHHLDTVIGERGYALSGGQRSRIALARALASAPPLLLLDEVNAMLEPALERRLWGNLAGLRAGATTVILTHHLAEIPPELITHRIDLPGPAQ
jgi:ABC-type multidrug transport system fused ATPase/permease subunit